MAKKPKKHDIKLHPDDDQMILFYSGSTAGLSLPEQALVDHPPSIMLTYWEIDGARSDTGRRFERHQQRRKVEQERLSNED